MPDKPTHLTLANRSRRFFERHPGLIFFCIGVLAATVLTFLFQALFALRHGGPQ